jgi:E3 ubiquitin-protein ligase RNF13
MVRAARRERAPEDIVRGLPWRVWTGTGWEKHDGSELQPSSEGAPANDVESGSANVPRTIGATTSGARDHDGALASTSEPSHVPATDSGDTSVHPPWANTQFECAICLSEFEVGDRVRVLPCDHIFHMDEVDGWLIHNKKLVRCSGPSHPFQYARCSPSILTLSFSSILVPCMQS